MFNKKNILITGGTGSFGQECVKFLSENYKPNKIIIFSRDENKQYEMQKTFTGKNIRFFIQNRLKNLSKLKNESLICEK